MAKSIIRIFKDAARGVNPIFYHSLCRRRFSREFIKKKVENTHCLLSEKEKGEIAKFWKPYTRVDYRYFEFYGKFCANHTDLKYYIPDDEYYGKIDLFFSNVQLSANFDNKNLYDLYFHDVHQPQTICRYNGLIFMDGKYNRIDENEVINKCREVGRVIVKPAVGSEGGRGICFWESETDSTQKLIEMIKNAKETIVQTIFEQHAILNAIYSGSVNTIRFVTLYNERGGVILSTILRMGRGGAKVDNASAGGVFCGVNKDGTLKRYSYDTLGNTFDGHPDGGTLMGISIPNFEKCKKMVLSLAPRVSHVSTLVSWDIAIDKEGEPALIEGNFSCGQLDFHQICNGPIFGERTPEILDMVYGRKTVK